MHSIDLPKGTIGIDEPVLVLDFAPMTVVIGGVVFKNK